MIALNDADSYAENDIDEKYLEEDAVDDEEVASPVRTKMFRETFRANTGFSNRRILPGVRKFMCLLR